MTPEHYKRLNKLFDRVVDLGAAERERILDACEDPQLRDDVERLLAGLENSPEFLDAPLEGIELGETSFFAETPGATAPGERVCPTCQARYPAKGSPQNKLT